MPDHEVSATQDDAAPLDDHGAVDRDKLLRLFDRYRIFLDEAPIEDERFRLTNRIMRYLFRARPNIKQVAALWGVISRFNTDSESEQLDAVKLDAAAKAIGYIMRTAHDPDRLKAARDILERSRIAEDGLATIADVVWMEDARFREAYRAGASISVWGHNIRYRAYTLMKCAERARALPGDFIECGVDRGGTASCVINYVGAASFAERQFYLFDTFRGLVEDQLTDEERQTSRITTGRYPNVLDQVRNTFAPYDFVRIIPGMVPDTLPEFAGERIAFLHIDMNAALPECAAFETFWPRLSPGAPVIFDDYGFPFHAPQRRALDAVAARLGTQIMMLPTCQGLAWKT